MRSLHSLPYRRDALPVSLHVPTAQVANAVESPDVAGDLAWSPPSFTPFRGPGGPSSRRQLLPILMVNEGALSCGMARIRLARCRMAVVKYSF